MFDFNTVITNSDNTLNDILLSTIDIKILFYNKYHILLDIENKDAMHFQEICNIRENEIYFPNYNGIKLLKNNLYNIFNDIFVNKTYIDDNGVKSYISSDGIFEIKVEELFNRETKYYIKLVNNINIDDISILCDCVEYNEICKNISDGCLNPITYYDFITGGNIEEEYRFIVNFQNFIGYMKYYWDKEKNIFYFIYNTEYIKYLENFLNVFCISNEQFFTYIKHNLLNKKKTSLSYKVDKIKLLYNKINTNLQKNYKYVNFTISNDLSGIPEIVLNSTCRKNNKGNEVLNVLSITFN
jgi:hypothetical protein|nr:MAG TPA: hypothetical protein [Caudoviricetes sp.]